MALKTDSTIVMWGAVPSASVHLTNVTAISAGQGYCLILVGDGLPVVQTRLAQTVVDADGFKLSLPSDSGRVYALEFKRAVDENAWTALPLSAGNGDEMLLLDAGNTNAQRFYRVRRW